MCLNAWSDVAKYRGKSVDLERSGTGSRCLLLPFFISSDVLFFFGWPCEIDIWLNDLLIGISVLLDASRFRFFAVLISSVVAVV